MLSYKSGAESFIKTSKITQSRNFEFSRFTTYGLGGKAQVAYFPKNILEAKSAYDALVSVQKDYKIVGNGSNLLVSDRGFDGGVICTRKLKGIVRISEDKILCLAGTTVGQLIKYCRDSGLGGLEYLYGIPATIGGAVFMNAGVQGFTIGNNVVAVKVYDGKTHVLSRENCNFSYRHSIMRDINAIILSIIVKVDKVSANESEHRLAYFRDRRKHLPVGKSCGCVFKNPPEGSAGYFIEKAGLKGLTVGGATVSDKHASFIINNNGSAFDVKCVIELVKKRVLEKFGVKLEEEVVYIGEFNEING